MTYLYLHCINRRACLTVQWSVCLDMENVKKKFFLTGHRPTHMENCVVDGTGSYIVKLRNKYYQCFQRQWIIKTQQSLLSHFQIPNFRSSEVLQESCIDYYYNFIDGKSVLGNEKWPWHISSKSQWQIWENKLFCLSLYSRQSFPPFPFFHTYERPEVAKLSYKKKKKTKNTPIKTQTKTP